MKDAIAAIASDDRRHWLKGSAEVPAACLPRFVKQLGFRIVHEDLGNDHGELDLEWGLIRVNSQLFSMMHHNTDLNRVKHFTIGHELGHLSLHPWYLQNGIPLTREHERQADFYAGVLLMPRTEILASSEWAEIEAGVSRNHQWKLIYALANRYKVTPTAMEIRLNDIRNAGLLITLQAQPPEPMPPQRSNVLEFSRAGAYA